MSRLIRAVPAARQRRDLLRAVAAAVGSACGIDEDEHRDLVAFSALALERFLESVEATAEAWERRGYWVKADRLRNDWTWVGAVCGQLNDCLAREDWSAAAVALTEAVGHLGGTQARRGKPVGRPWLGAYEAWQARELHRRQG